MIGYCICGSFCTHAASLDTLTKLRESGVDIQPVLSETVCTTSTRFGDCDDFKNKVETICGRKIICTMRDAEVLGPQCPLDALIISPCTGNTLAKIAHGITDTAVCMAFKAHSRQSRPCLIALASNDAMSANLENIAPLINKKNIFFVPMRQDDPVKKPHSLVADFTLIPECLNAMKDGRQIRPLFI